MTTKVCIASSRWPDIGEMCIQWAEENMPPNCVISAPDDCDVFISVMYGNLVSEEFISKRKCYNFHPGILPQYRGAGAFSWSIINGDKRCGVTLHELDVDIDTGPIIDMATFAIEAWDTAGSLFEKGMAAIYELFMRWFTRLVTYKDGDTLYATEQDEYEAHTYYRKDLKMMQDLTRFVRAFTFGGKESAFYIDHSGKKIELRW